MCRFRTPTCILCFEHYGSRLELRGAGDMIYCAGNPERVYPCPRLSAPGLNAPQLTAPESCTRCLDRDRRARAEQLRLDSESAADEIQTGESASGVDSGPTPMQWFARSPPGAGSSASTAFQANGTGSPTSSSSSRGAAPRRQLANGTRTPDGSRDGSHLGTASPASRQSSVAPEQDPTPTPIGSRAGSAAPSRNGGPSRGRTPSRNGVSPGASEGNRTSSRR